MHPSTALLPLLLCAAVTLVAATPAFPGPYDMPLPDGSSLRVWNTGDECTSGRSHITGPRYVDAEGRNVYVHDDGTPSYYDPSGAPAGPLASRRQAAEQAKYSPATMPDEWDAGARQRRSAFARDLRASALAKRVRTHATEPLVFLLVQYPDFASGRGITEHIQRTVFNSSSDEGNTVNAYYNLASNGKFHFTRAPETSAVRDDGVIGPVTVPCSWVNHTQWGVYPDYSCVERNALLGAAEFLDLKSFDLDGNKHISGDELHIVLVIAGGDLARLSPLGASRCPHVWGFMAPSFDVEAQGVTFGQHVVVGENWDDCTRPFGIGIVTHELGHTLSLPDIYDQDGGIPWVGPFCLMDAGNWNNDGKNPAMISPFLRSYLGWITPTVVASSSKDPISLLPVGDHPDAVLQFGDNPKGVDWECSQHSGTGEYFLVENRQKVGVDKYLPGAGVIVWHVNEAAAPDSTHSNSLFVIERIVRKTVNAHETVPEDDVLTSSARQTLYCGVDRAQVPNSRFDNEATSCVSLSATIDTDTLVATIEPWSDTTCGSCVRGRDAFAQPTTEYGFIEQYGFSLVPMSSATAITFGSNNHASIKLPLTVTFGGRPYTEAFVSANGLVSFLGINTGISGAGKYPTIAPYAGSTQNATFAAAVAFACAAPMAPGQCYAIQWVFQQITVQAVLHQNGNIYFIYSGTIIDGFRAFVSTGISGSVMSADPFWQTYDWTLPTAAPAALLVAPKPIELLRLPFSDSFETVNPSSWSSVMCGRASDACGSASGNALTFYPTNCHNRMATPYGFDVSRCATVAVSFFLGPSGPRPGCDPADSTIFWGYTLGSQMFPSWIGANNANATNGLEVATGGAERMYIAFDYQGPGMVYIDDLNAGPTVKDTETLAQAETSIPVVTALRFRPRVGANVSALSPASDPHTLLISPHVTWDQRDADRGPSKVSVKGRLVSPALLGVTRSATVAVLGSVQFQLCQRAPGYALHDAPVET
eukprot:m51a1_g915 hypothetical protein (987) ;mRNA; f:143303-147687